MPPTHTPSRRAWLSPVPLILGLLLLTRCSPSNSLSGSVSEIFPLDFNSVVVWVSDTSFQVSYYFTQFGNEDLVVQLAVDTTGLTIKPGVSIDLSQDTTTGQPRAQVTHVAHAEATLVLPRIAAGTLHINSGSLPGDHFTGSFNLSFVNDGTVGSLRTISGGFDDLSLNGNFPPDANYPADAGPDGGLDGGGTTSVGTTTSAGSSGASSAGASSTGASAVGTSAGTSGSSTSAGAASTSGGSSSASTSSSAGAGSTSSTSVAASSAGSTSAAGASSTGGSTGATTGGATTSGATTSGATTGGATTGGASSAGSTTGTTCTSTNCPSPGGCGVNSLTCCPSAGAGASSSTCTSDCDCASFNCSTTCV